MAQTSTLHDFLPKDKWWEFYINPKDHEQARKLSDPGLLYDKDQSPGYQQGMVSAYERFLDDPTSVRTPMDSNSYKTMHGIATGHLTLRRTHNGQTEMVVRGELEWSGRKITYFPLRTDSLTPDILQEKVGSRPLISDTTSSSFDWSKRANPPPVTILMQTERKPGKAMATNYKMDQAPGLVELVFAQHYEAVKKPQTTFDAKLASIARTVRSLQVIHPFVDGNLRCNVQVLLPKLLLELRIRPIMPNDMYSLFQGGVSVDDMVRSLRRNGATTF